MPLTPSDTPPWVDNLPLSVAIAGLFVEVAQLDGTYENEEKAMVGGWLAHFLDISPHRALALRKQAEVSQSKSMTFYAFATKTRDHLSKSQQKALYEELKRVALANRSVSAGEEHFLSSLKLIFNLAD